MRTLGVIRDYALETRGDSVLWELAIDGVIKELGDPYATVLSPDEVARFEEQSTGNYAGVGIAISELNGAVTITTVFGGTPAEDAGLMVGDRIVGVDSDEGDGWSVDDASTRIRGEPGTTVIVYIERDGFDEAIPFEIERDEVHIPAVRAARIFDEFSYIVLDRVTRNSGGGFRFDRNGRRSRDDLRSPAEPRWLPRRVSQPCRSVPGSRFGTGYHPVENAG